MPKGTEKGKAPSSSAGKGRAMDFSGVKPFDPLDEKLEDGKTAIYPARIFKITTDKSGPKGLYDEVVFEVLAPEKYHKRQLFRNYPLNESARPFYYELLKAANPDVELGSDFVMVPEEWLGLEVGISVENETYEEQIRSRVKKVHPSSKVNVS